MTRRAAIATLGRRHSGDPDMDSVWRQLDALARIVANSPFLSGRLITEEDGAVRGSGLAFTAATPRSIAHRLGRPASGFIEVYGAAIASAGHVGLRSTSSTASHLTVTPAATGTCWMWVF